MTKVKMFWWNEQPNFGDSLNPIILKRLFNVETEWADMHNADLVGAGSCLQWVAAETIKRPREIHIWGAGYMYDKEPAVHCKQVVFHAVRGNNTRNYSDLNKIALGDPGILSSLLFNKPITKKHKVGIVPHLWNQNDDKLRDIKRLYRHVKIIDVCDPPMTVLEQIASCDFIYSSSLHGLIVADSFGIPNQWVTFTKPLFGGDWKFNDYYSVYAIVPPQSIQFKQELVSEDSLNTLSRGFEVRAGINEMQQSLIQAFPKQIAD
jgi:pyruvyltransferase